jgi:methylase of polypeptide subunit release factors
MAVSLVKEVHQRLAEVIGSGDLCLDATAGNGLDTLFLAQRAGDAGAVHAMDVQKDALRITERLLEQHHVRERVTTHLACHSQMEAVLPGTEKGRIRAITFNLGYLPKGDKTITTRKETTLPAVRNAYDWLAENGVLSVLCYRGHPGGKAEEEAVRELIDDCNWKRETIFGKDSSESPVLHFIEKT